MERLRKGSIVSIFTSAADMGFVLLFFFILSLGAGFVNNTIEIDLPYSKRKVLEGQIPPDAANIIITGKKELTCRIGDEIITQFDITFYDNPKELYNTIEDSTEKFVEELITRQVKDRDILAFVDSNTQISFLVPIAIVIAEKKFELKIVTSEIGEL